MASGLSSKRCNNKFITYLLLTYYDVVNIVNRRSKNICIKVMSLGSFALVPTGRHISQNSSLHKYQADYLMVTIVLYQTAY